MVNPRHMPACLGMLARHAPESWPGMERNPHARTEMRSSVQRDPEVETVRVRPEAESVPVDSACNHPDGKFEIPFIRTEIATVSHPSAISYGIL